MLPVCGYVPPPGLGIGTAFAENVTVGAAEAAAGRPTTARQPSKARQVDALRISFSPLLMDRSASIRVAPEPLPVRRYRDLRQLTGEQWRCLLRRLSIAAGGCKLERG